MAAYLAIAVVESGDKFAPARVWVSRVLVDVGLLGYLILSFLSVCLGIVLDYCLLRRRCSLLIEVINDVFTFSHFINF